MTIIQTVTLTFRVRPEIKAALREAAEREHRSLTNMLEVMICHYQGQDLQLGPLRGHAANGSQAH
ncbi:hypothetical protein [uncultured Thiocystis sp.]|uniref:type II toxin -antitoxin system TacA 1-like antitoxin n=1 Tax=uncultured Thiocystis sp. TaxID=1202134 RepID=UPI0025D7ECCA|nr:hypothetical protein [uncultured Thiocystis sp.]